MHALELGDALTRLGYEATVFAPDVDRDGLLPRAHFAPPHACGFPVGRANVPAMVETRVADYVRHFERPENRRFDVWHAQDGISGNALATLKERGLISGFARTVHHVDAFDDERLSASCRRAPSRRPISCSSSARYGAIGSPAIRARRLPSSAMASTRSRFSPTPDATDDELRAAPRPAARRARLSCRRRRRERKNTIRLLQAFPRYACRSAVAAGHRWRRFAAGPRRLSGAFRRAAGAWRRFGRRGDPDRTVCGSD